MRTDHATGERRPVTAMFVDVVGSTSLAENMDPEDWAATMEEAMALMTEAVERYDGWVASHTGDGFMAIFGLPTAHEDDPARAVSAAIEMTEAIDGFAQPLRAGGTDYRIRIGLNTGEVVARDTAGGGAAGDPRMYGDTLNVAARMQSEAPPGGIMITDETHRRLSDKIESRHVGPVNVKGKAAPVEAYEVLGRTGTLRSVRGLVGLRSPMVGRDAELARLTDTFAPVRAGLGRMAVIAGEPGIGKSRLLVELRAAAEAAGFGWVEARTVSYGRKLPMHLAIDLVRALLGLPDPIESIPADEAAAQVASTIRGLDGLESDEVIPLASHLLSLPLDEAGAERLAHMEPRTLRLRYTGTITSLVSASAQGAPLVVVCDDVHWADDTSVELLGPAAAAVSARPVLWVLATRMERDVPGWRLVGAAQEAFGDALVDIRLQPLDAGDGQQLVANLLEIDSLPTMSRALILARAEGNPLYVEEIIRMLIDSEAIEFRDGRWRATEAIADIEIPASLHGLLLARIDRLPRAARHVLRVASTIGRTFGVRVLERVVRGDDEATDGLGSIGTELSLLEGTGLIELAASSPELEYTFRHALIQDAAYATLLKPERRSLHLAVAESLLALYPDHDELAPVLARHFEQADDRPRAIEFLALAARLARSRFARHEAVDLASRALALLPADDEIDSGERRVRAAMRLIQAAAGIDFLPLNDSRALLDGAIADATVVGDSATATRAYLLIARSRAMAGDQIGSSPELAQALDQATALAQQTGSRELVAVAVLARGQAHFMASEFDTSVDLIEPILPALVDAGRVYDASVAAGQLGMAYGHLGQFDEAVRWTDRATELGTDSGDPNASLDADLARSIVEGIRGDTTTAIEYATKAAEVAERVDNKACMMVAHGVIGEQHLRDGRHDPGRTLLRDQRRPGGLLPVHAGQDRADRAAAPDRPSPLGYRQRGVRAVRTRARSVATRGRPAGRGTALRAAGKRPHRRRAVRVGRRGHRASRDDLRKPGCRRRPATTRAAQRRRAGRQRQLTSLARPATGPFDT